LGEISAGSSAKGEEVLKMLVENRITTSGQCWQLQREIQITWTSLVNFKLHKTRQKVVH
jgi:hypothetical protein